jgi:hypothetical protein
MIARDSEWADIVQDLERLCETDIKQDGKVYFAAQPGSGLRRPRAQDLGCCFAASGPQRSAASRATSAQATKTPPKTRRRSDNAALVPSKALI